MNQEAILPPEHSEPLPERCEIVLTEHSKIPKEYQALCQRIQHDIDEDILPVVDLSSLTKGNQKKIKPKIFDYFSGHYMTMAYVGTICYKGQLIVVNSRFSPKGSQHFFQRFLLESRVKYLKLIYDQESTGNLSEFSDLVVLQFFQQVHTATSQGQYRHYRQYAHNNSRFRGSLDLPRHLRLNPMDNGNIAYNTRDYTIENPINQLIVTAAQKLATHSDSKEAYLLWNTAQLFPLTELKTLIHSLPPASLKQRDVLQLLRATQAPIRHPLYQNYELLRRSCRLILQNKGFSPLEMGEEVQAGLVFDMDDAWEHLLEEYLLPVESECQLNVPILEGSYRLEIDAYVPFPNGKRAVFDAKNKKSWADYWKKSYPLQETKANANKSPESPENRKDSQSVSDKNKKKITIPQREDLFQVLSYHQVMGTDFCGVIFPVEDVPVDALDYSQYKLKIVEEPLGPLGNFYSLPVPIPSDKDLSYLSYVNKIEETLKLCKEKLLNLSTLEEAPPLEDSSQDTASTQE